MSDREALSGEDVITAAQAGRLARSAANPVQPGTVRRWIQAGVVGRGGARVRLQGYRCGGGWVTSVQAVGRFLAAVNATVPPTGRPATAGRRKQKEKARAEAEALGV